MIVGERTGGRAREVVGVVREWWRTWPVTARDTVLAVALAVAAYVPGVALQGIAFAELPEHRAGWLRARWSCSRRCPSRCGAPGPP